MFGHVYIAAALIVSFASGSCRVRSNANSHVDSAFSQLESGHPEVVQINYVYRRIQQGRTVQESIQGCSSVAISQTTMLTAKHCINGGSGAVESLRQPNNPQMKDLYFEVGQEKVYPRRIFILPEPTKEARIRESDVIDLAIVEFPKPVFHTYASLAPTSPEVGDRIKIVGFGDHGNANYFRYYAFVSPSPVPQAVLEDLDEDRDEFLAQRRKFIDSRRLPASDPERARFDRLEAKFKNISQQQKRSGFNEVSGLLKKGMIEFHTSRTPKAESEQWVRLLHLFQADDFVDQAKEGIMCTVGDSGGPMYDAKGALLGIASYASFGSVRSPVRIGCGYTNLQDSRIQSEFFAAAKAAGFTVPKAGPSTTPPPQALAKIEKDSDLVAALSGAESASGDYQIIAASNTAYKSLWFCPDTAFEACADKLTKQAGLILLSAASDKSAGAQYFTPANVKITGSTGQGFSLIGLTEDGRYLGVSVKVQKLK